MPYSLPGLIDRACSPSRFDPNLAVNLEVCEIINTKQGSSPRVAAQAIVRHVNSTKINQAMLALTLLDNCVKNCGYPFHLQIASKEFLNALVRRFPERPPAKYAPNPVTSAPENQWNHFDYIPNEQYMASPVIDRILYLIKEWKMTLADLASYKEDMVHIKDMYRLLKFKGYQFPEIRDSSIAALAPSESLKSAHELEEEDRLAKSAKLQELIRRGRPQDLVEANALMKIMSGYDQKHQVNFKEQFAEELHKIQNKARLLYEMLDNMKEGDVIDDEGTMDELKSSCESALPKIHNMLKEEEDQGRIEELEEVKSIIKGVVLKFQDVKQGRYNTSYDMSGKYRTIKDDNYGAHTAPPQAISLIDLDDLDSASTTTTPVQKNTLDELSDIFDEKATVASPRQTDSFDQKAAVTSPQQTDIFDLLSQPSLPKQESIIKTIELVNKNGIHIQLDVYKTGSLWEMKAIYSNKSTAPMDKMTLQLAVPKSMHLNMGAVSSTSLPPKSDRAMVQTITIDNPNKDKLRLRYKVTYEQFGVDMEQMGEYHD